MLTNVKNKNHLNNIFCPQFLIYALEEYFKYFISTASAECFVNLNAEVFKNNV